MDHGKFHTGEGKAQVVVYDDAGRTLTVMNWIGGSPDDYARAVSIAKIFSASADMLAALKAILPHINAGEALIANAAIAKAEGRA